MYRYFDLHVYHKAELIKVLAVVVQVSNISPGPLVMITFKMHCLQKRIDVDKSQFVNKIDFWNICDLVFSVKISMFYQVKRHKNVTKQLKGDKNMCFLRLKKNHNIKYTRFFQFNQSSCVIPVDIFTILFIIHGSNSIATQLIRA